MIPQLWDLLEYTINDGRTEIIPIIWSHQNAPRVGKPYILIEYTNVDTPDFDIHSREVDEYGVQTLSSWRNASVNLQFYFGPESYSIASRIVYALAAERSINKAVELDCAVGQRLFFSRVPALLNESQWEDRTIYSFEFMWTEHFDDQVGIIENVEITGEYVGGGVTDPEAAINQCYHIIPKDDCPTVWDEYTTVWDYYTIPNDIIPQASATRFAAFAVTTTDIPQLYTPWDTYVYAIWDSNVALWDGHDVRWDERYCKLSTWDHESSVWDKGKSLWDCDIHG